MNTLTVKDIKDRLQEVKDEQDPFLAQCENDPRKSVQTLVEQWIKKQAKVLRCNSVGPCAARASRCSFVP